MTLRSGYDGRVSTVSPSVAIIRFITHKLGSLGDLPSIQIRIYQTYFKTTISPL